jgi:gamma-glutamyltranspeptidase / glutathione hydrolase
MQFDPQLYPYPSRRTPVYARNGMVATSQPLAAQAGLEVLRKGGNAVDAAIATAAALTVVEPTSNGIGGDAFALVWVKGKLHGLNASGPAPQAISREALERAGVTEIPKYGFIPVTVPGAPSAWAELSARFGKLPLTEVLAPAIAYAEQGYPLTPTLGYYWKNAFNIYSKNLSGEEFKHWFDTFAPEGRAPEVGEMWRSEDHARTLRLIAETKGEAFYRGELAEQIDAYSRKHGGYIRKEDLAAYKPDWVDPIGVNYRGYDVWEIPPNGQGLVTLLALNILEGFEFAERDTVETYHKQIEAIKLAFADGKRYIADPRAMTVSVQDLLSKAYAAERRKLITDRAQEPVPGTPPQGGTVYLCTADGEGNMVSFIQSNYMGFGSGLVVPGTGVGLQNRGRDFSLDPASDNRLEPGKKAYHTIIPGFMTKDGQAVGPFGVMGGYMQPQGHLQVVMNTVDFHLNPQAALDAPRWQWMEGRTVEIETGAQDHVVQKLARMGHGIKWALGNAGFGRGEIIWRLSNGVMVGATEPRADGQVAAF